MFLGEGLYFFTFQLLLDKSWSRVSSLLRCIIFVRTVQHSRLLVDFHRVLPTTPMKQEKVSFTNFCCGDHFAKVKVASILVRVVLEQQQYGINTTMTRNKCKHCLISVSDSQWVLYFLSKWHLGTMAV